MPPTVQEGGPTPTTQPMFRPNLRTATPPAQALPPAAPAVPAPPDVPARRGCLRRSRWPIFARKTRCRKISRRCRRQADRRQDCRRSRRGRPWPITARNRRWRRRRQTAWAGHGPGPDALASLPMAPPDDPRRAIGLALMKQRMGGQGAPPPAPAPPPPPPAPPPNQGIAAAPPAAPIQKMPAPQQDVPPGWLRFTDAKWSHRADAGADERDRDQAARRDRAGS